MRRCSKSAGPPSLRAKDCSGGWVTGDWRRWHGGRAGVGGALSTGLTIVWTVVPAAIRGPDGGAARRTRELEKQRRAARFFESGLARLEGRWAGTGSTGDRYLDPAHPYAQDLDLFGKGSLFELLSTARTHIGEDTLARWLLAPADPATVRARQQAVEELRPRLDLREDLAVVAEEARTGVDPGRWPPGAKRRRCCRARPARLVLWALHGAGDLRRGGRA